MSDIIQSGGETASVLGTSSEGIGGRGGGNATRRVAGARGENLRALGVMAFLALLAGASLKAWLLLGGSVPFNADEAIVALMARHILQGELPAFFYGQAYMGSLDAFLVALGFAWLGEAVWVIRLVQTALFLGTIATSMVIARRVFGGWTAGVATGWILAVPAVNLSLYTTASLGNYGEALLLGNLILLTAFRIATATYKLHYSESWPWLAFGVLAGLGFWAFGLTLVYTVPAMFYLAWWLRRSSPGSRGNKLRSVSLAGAGFLLGSLPFWISGFQTGFSGAFEELGGSAISGVAGLGFGASLIQQTINFVLFGATAALGLRPPWEVRWLALPLIPFITAFWVGVVVFLVKNVRQDLVHRRELLLLAGVGLALITGFIITPFGADPSGRYFLPLMILLAIFAGGLVQYLAGRYRPIAWALVGLVLVFHFGGTLAAVSRTPPGLTTQFDPVTQIDRGYDDELIAFLRSEGIGHGYSNYWVTYPLAFLSGESIIFLPRLPYHQDFRYTVRDDRYPPYREIVETAQEVAYITTHNPLLDARLRSGFSGLGVRWSEQKIGDYQIFFRLSEPVRPDDLGLGETTP